MPDTTVTTPDGPTGICRPSLNHVATSMPADALDNQGRADIVEFYRHVFGWQELTPQTADRERLVLAASRCDQFVFLIADDNPVTTSSEDQFGVSVDSLENLETLLERAKTVRETDDRVNIVDYSIDDHAVVTIHGFCVRYLLERSVKMQFWEWRDDLEQVAEGFAAEELGRRP